MTMNENVSLIDLIENSHLAQNLHTFKFHQNNKSEILII